MTDSILSSSDFKLMLNSKDGDGYYYILFNILSYLDVCTLVEKKSVCRQWPGICDKVIDAKANPKKRFKGNQELRAAVTKYEKKENADDMEDIASHYGWPIGKWDVSEVTDLSRVLAFIDLNEDISGWNVCNATDMGGMFLLNKTFNQDISSWDVSNVSRMCNMFDHAEAFNQDISCWNVSNVTNMAGMFDTATSFDQDISPWDISNVMDMSFMFYDAILFNRDLSSWFALSDAWREELHSSGFSFY